MVRKNFFLYTTRALILCAAGLHARIIHVPSSSVPTIRLGIIAAQDGDTVMVTPGI